jgi:transcriptional regulator with XRE-family HTH domain
MGRIGPAHITDSEAFGRRVRELRTERGLSLREMAFRGCSPSFLSRVEAGRRVPSPAVVAQIANRLGVDVETLLGHRLDSRVRDADLAAADVAARLGEPDAGARLEALLAQARGLHDQAAESRVLEGLGLVALDARRDGEAVELLERALATGSATGARERPALHRALGRAYAGSGDLVRAIGVLDAAFADASAEPPDPALMVLFGSYLANAFTDAGRFGEAEAVLARALAHERDLAPGNALRLEWAMARTYAEQGRLPIAEAYTRRVLRRLDTSEHAALLGQTHLLLAGVLLDQGRIDEAVPHIDRSSDLLAGAPAVDLVQVSLERARVALARGDHDAAAGHAREALDRTGATEPGHAGTAYSVLARVELARGNLDDARFLCREAIEQMTGRAAPHYVAAAYETLADVEEEAGDLRAALAALRARPGIRIA